MDVSNCAVAYGAVTSAALPGATSTIASQGSNGPSSFGPNNSLYDINKVSNTVTVTTDSNGTAVVDTIRLTLALNSAAGSVDGYISATVTSIAPAR